MKKSLLLLSALILGGMGANAQITVTTGDVAIPVRVIRQATDNLPTVSEGSAGINQTWNMTALNTSILDSLTFLTASWGPDAAMYPGSNLSALTIDGTDTNYVYLNNSASGLTAQGSVGRTDFGSGTRSKIMATNTPSEVLLNFPANYLSSTTNNYHINTPAFYFGIDPGVGTTIDSARQRSGVKKKQLIDAWGSLTTPLGTFNVLRVKEDVVRYDTTDVLLGGTWNPIPGFTPLIAADSTTSYSWWANGVGFPLVTLTLDSASLVTEAKWLQAFPTVGINESVNATSVNVFPNPAQNQINFTVESDKVVAIQILDITGRMIDLILVNGNNVVINTSNRANGVYSYALVGKDNAILNRGKFTVAK